MCSFCYEILWLLFLVTKKLITQAFQAFISSSRYLDYLLNIDNPYFEGIVGQINLPEIQLNKASASDINAIFLDLHIPVSISHGFASFKICYKPNDFDFDVVNFSFFFLDGDTLRSTSYGIYISQLIRFATVTIHLAYLNASNKF